MDDYRRLWPTIPEPSDFESHHSPHTPVPSAVIESTIDLLYCLLAQVRRRLELTPQERQLIALFGDPHLFQALVEYLEPSPASWLLKVWGVAHGVYPADRMPPPPVEELKAMMTLVMTPQHRNKT